MTIVFEHQLSNNREVSPLPKLETIHCVRALEYDRLSNTLIIQQGYQNTLHVITTWTNVRNIHTI